MRDALGELYRGRGGVGPQREEGQRFGLLGGGLREFGAAVAGLHDEQPRQSIEVAVAAVVPDCDALTAGDDGRRDPGAVTGEMPPQVAVGLGGQFSHLTPQLYCCLTSFR